MARIRACVGNARSGSRVDAAVVRPALLLAFVACGRSDSAPPSISAPGAAPAPAVAAHDAALPPTPLLPCPVAQRTLGAGLDVERWPIVATPAAGGPACVDVVRIDPARYALRVLSVSDEAGARNAPGWADAFHLAAVINAGMFHASGKPVGLIVADGAERSGNNTKMSGYLAWDPIAATDPPVTIAGRGCAGFDLDDLRARYHSVVQSYRLLGCDGEALPWKDPKQYSAAAIGVDRAGRVVLLHARAAVTMAELARALAAHDLAGALFLEGGPEASLVARGPDGELARVGSFETGFVENDGNQVFWALPNVIAVFPR